MRSSSGAQEPLLPSGPRVSSSAMPRKTQPDSPWYAALGRCLVYVWPKRQLLQLAACSCILLLLCIRLLNLAVPVFYGRTVDVLSKVADDARDGKLPHDTGRAFAHAMWPWVIMYLMARFLQGGGTASSTCSAWPHGMDTERCTVLGWRCDSWLQRTPLFEATVRTVSVHVLLRRCHASNAHCFIPVCLRCCEEEEHNTVCMCVVTS